MDLTIRDLVILLASAALTQAAGAKAEVFNCPALSQSSNVFARSFTISRDTPVPAKETTYMCQAFELSSTAIPVHMIGSRPRTGNRNLVRHMKIYSCFRKPEQKFFDGPQECFMGSMFCSKLVNFWAYGEQGECFNETAGYLVGGNGGLQYALLQVQWSNPSRLTGLRDSSGFTLYFTKKLRKHNLGTIVYGETNLVLPPRQPKVSVYHTCPVECSIYRNPEIRYITAVGIHMHKYGIRGRVSQWRLGVFIRDLLPMQAYEFNSPRILRFDPPVEYLIFDEVRTECHYSTMSRSVSTFFGFGETDEMCFSFVTYYPNDVSKTASEKLESCTAVSGMHQCWSQIIGAQVEQGCNITAMKSGEIPNRVLSEMTANKCFARSGCDPACRDYLNNTLWPSNACYDPKRARQMAEVLAAKNKLVADPVKQTIMRTLFGQRFCEQEIKMLADMSSRARHDSLGSDCSGIRDSVSGSP